MTFEQTRCDLILLAAKVGHRTPPGHHCHTMGSLLGIEPEHENHARRRKAGLVVQTVGMARALQSVGSPASPGSQS